MERYRGRLYYLIEEFGVERSAYTDVVILYQRLDAIEDGEHTVEGFAIQLRLLLNPLNFLNPFSDGACEPYETIGEFEGTLFVLEWGKELAQIIVHRHVLWREVVYHIAVEAVV